MQAEQQSERKPLSDEQVRVIYKEWLNAPGHANEFDLIQMAARAALSHPSTPQGWQQISTAPEGVSVLACNALGFVGRAHQRAGKWEHIGKPTHWMPLPPPPPEQGSKG